MNDFKAQKPPQSTHTTINRTETPSSGSGATLWFLLGGVVIAIAVIAYFVLGDGMQTSTSPAPTGGDVSINVDTAPAADPAPTAAPTPAPATEATPTETAPATPIPAPEATPQQD